MKYHGHEIIKVPEDLGENDARRNAVYKIFKDGVYKATALTTGTAKDYIDTGYNENYL
jgi:hypothetical protein